MLKAGKKAPTRLLVPITPAEVLEDAGPRSSLRKRICHDFSNKWLGLPIFFIFGASKLLKSMKPLNRPRPTLTTREDRKRDLATFCTFSVCTKWTFRIWQKPQVCVSVQIGSTLSRPKTSLLDVSKGRSLPLPIVLVGLMQNTKQSQLGSHVRIC